MENKQEYILCAAIKRIEPRQLDLYYNNDINNIEIGYRHRAIFANNGHAIEDGDVKSWDRYYEQFKE